MNNCKPKSQQCKKLWDQIMNLNTIIHTLPTTTKEKAILTNKRNQMLTNYDALKKQEQKS